MNLIKIMAELPRFFIASSPKALPGVELIMHAREPFVMAAIQNFNTLEEREAFVEEIKSSKFPSYVFFKNEPALLYIKYEIVKGTIPENHDLSGLLERMSDWYFHTVFQRKTDIKRRPRISK